MKTPKKGKPIILGKVKTYLTGNAFTLSWYADGERKREMRSTLEDALSRAKEINKDLDAGRGHVKSFTATETALLNTCIESNYAKSASRSRRLSASMLPPIASSVARLVSRKRPEHIRMPGPKPTSSRSSLMKSLPNSFSGANAMVFQKLIKRRAVNSLGAYPVDLARVTSKTSPLKKSATS